jgi:DNA-binding transcriptional ArsR family regulator
MGDLRVHPCPAAPQKTTQRPRGGYLARALICAELISLVLQRLLHAYEGALRDLMLHDLTQGMAIGGIQGFLERLRPGMGANVALLLGSRADRNAPCPCLGISVADDDNDFSDVAAVQREMTRALGDGGAESLLDRARRTGLIRGHIELSLRKQQPRHRVNCLVHCVGSLESPLGFVALVDMLPEVRQACEAGGELCDDDSDDLRQLERPCPGMFETRMGTFVALIRAHLLTTRPPHAAEVPVKPVASAALTIPQRDALRLAWTDLLARTRNHPKAGSRELRTRVDRLISMLACRFDTVGDFADALGVSHSTAYRHLNALPSRTRRWKVPAGRRPETTIDDVIRETAALLEALHVGL